MQATKCQQDIDKHALTADMSICKNNHAEFI